MPDLVLGPMLRYVGDHDATVWVETDAPCQVEVLGVRERTFHVEGHHYALLLIAGLEPDSSTPYTVRLDGGQDVLCYRLADSAAGDTLPLEEGQRVVLSWNQEDARIFPTDKEN